RFVRYSLLWRTFCATCARVPPCTRNVVQTSSAVWSAERFSKSRYSCSTKRWFGVAVLVIVATVLLNCWPSTACTDAPVPKPARATAAPPSASSAAAANVQSVRVIFPLLVVGPTVSGLALPLAQDEVDFAAGGEFGRRLRLLRHDVALLHGLRAGLRHRADLAVSGGDLL